MSKNVKKICFFVGDLSRTGGTERVTADLANELCQLADKYEIHILSLYNENVSNFFKVSNDITEHVLSDKPILKFKNVYFKIVFEVRKYMKCNNIDVLIDVDTILDVFSVPATRFINTKLISWEHFNFYENLGVVYRDWGRRLSAKFADAIVTITEEDRGYFEKNLNLRAPIYTIHNSISLIETTNKYDKNSKIIISAGRLTYQKGFDLLIEVAREVFNKHPDWTWIILGEGEARKDLENTISKYHLNNNVVLEGNVRNIEEYYKKSSMFVLTSRYEGFGLVLTEAKAYGLPCISFKCKAGPSEIIQDNINGFLISTFDIEAMAKKICNLIEDQKMRESFSNNALVGTDIFMKSNVIAKWEKLLDSM